MPRVEYEGAIYHVTVRMAGHAWETGHGLNPSVCLFRDDAERERFVDQLGERVDAYGIRLYAWCLMLTHFHLYLETPGANLGRFMHSLETAYTVYSNLRRERHGPLVGRYKAKPVEGDSYHLGLSRYVHLNPVRTTAAREQPLEERLKRLREYRWSSYQAYAGRQKPPSWLACAPILAFCGSRRPTEQRREYRRFVESGVGPDGEEDRDRFRNSAPAIGDDAFVDWIREQLIERGREAKCPEDTALRRVSVSLSAVNVLEVTARMLNVEPVDFQERRRNSDLRGIAARVLCRYAGLTQREAAGVLNMKTGAAVGQQLQRLQSRLATDPHLRRLLADIEESLTPDRSR